MQTRTAVAVAFMTQALAIGTTLGPISLFMRPIADEFGVSLATVGTGATLIFVMMAVSGMINGPQLDKGHIRRTMLTGAVLLALALLSASRVNTLWQLGLCCIAIGGSVPMLGPLTGSTLVGKVATEGRGRALGIMNIGAPAGSVAFALLAGVLIESIGWRGTFAIYGCVVGIIAPPWVLWAVPRSVMSAPKANDDSGLTPRELFSNIDFRLIATAQGIGAGLAMGWAVHLAPYLQGLGATTRGASGVIAAGSGIGVLGGLAFGYLVDRRNPRNVMIFVLLSNAAGFALLSANPALAYAAAVAIAIGFVGGGILPIFTTLLAKRFGPESLGRAFGLTNLFMLPLGLGLPPIAGYVMSTQGSYSVALWGMVGIYACGVFALTHVRGSFDR
jgi:predicted MFS family arabinose efflux permease